MLNKIVLQGRLAREPELRQVNDTYVCNFTLAVDRDRESPCDFIDCAAWGSTANFVDTYFRKGNMMVLVGRLESRKWEDHDGNKRTSWAVRAENVYFGEAKRDER